MGCSGRASAGKGRRRNLRHRPRSTVYVVFLTLSSLAVVDADSSRAAEGEHQNAAQNHGDLTAAGLGNVVLAGVGFPLGDIGDILGHGFGDLWRPVAESVAPAGGLAVERGGGGAGQQVVLNLILERLTLCAVGVGHGVEFLPLGGVGDILCHGLGNLRIPTAKPIALTGGSYF